MEKIKFTEEQIQKARDVPIHWILGVQEGREVSVRCPFHSDRSPSLRIYTNNSYHCFGCNKHGYNAVDFIMDTGASFNEAVSELLNDNN
jgi:DNA primase